MGTLYTSQAAVAYNATPPPDDGSQGANNQITWNTTIKAKLADPIKTLADAINSQLTTVLDLSARAISTNDSAIASDHWRTLQVTNTTTITLSDAASMTNKYVVGIANLGVGTVTVTRATAGNTVNGTAADFTIPPKSAVVLGVNQGATGYNIISSTGGNSNNTSLVATTSVTTPLVSPASGSLTLGLTGQSVLPAADNTSPLGGASFRWSSLFTPIIDSGTTGSLSLKTNNGTEGFRVVNTPSAVNLWAAIPNTTGNGAVLAAIGSDTNVVGLLRYQGTGGFSFQNSSGAATQFQILDTASTTRNITVTGSNGGNPILSATAGNIALGTGLILSAGNTALTDYSQGTWTPSLGGNTTYNTQAGIYTKIGRLVFIQGQINVNVIGTGSTTLVSGLPFTAAAQVFHIGIAGSAALATAVVSLQGQTTSNATTFAIVSRTAAGTTEGSNAIFQNGTNVTFSGCYSV